MIEIFVMDAGGADVRQLTHNPFEATSPAWSPESNHIAYSGWASDGSREIFVVDIRGNSDLDHGPTHRRPAARLDAGRWLDRFLGPADHTPVRSSGSVDIETGDVYPVLDAPSWLPDWSPSGEQIVFVGADARVEPDQSDRVSLANSDGTGRRQLSDVWSDWPLWSPDGTTIAYNVWSNDGDTVAVWLYDVATGGHRLLRNGVGTEFWEDDGTLLVSTVEAS